jgi:hypothetical protein
MKLKPVFTPLKNKKALKVFFISALTLSVIYVVFSVSLSMFVTTPLPGGTFFDYILFGGFNAFSTFLWYNWIILSFFPILGGLLFANYTYYKCKVSKTGQGGLAVGLLAATCPACILPLVGVFSFVALLTKYTIIVNIAALFLILGTTIYVANKKGKC